MKLLCPILFAFLTACSTKSDMASSTFPSGSGCWPMSHHYPGLLTHIDADGYAFVWAPYSQGAEIPPEFLAVVRLPSNMHDWGTDGATLSPRAWFGDGEPHVTLSCLLDDHNAYGPRRDDLPSDHYAPKMRSFTVNDRPFEPSSGRVLLIDARVEPFRVVQHQCDPQRRTEIQRDFFKAGRSLYRELDTVSSKKG